MQLLFRTMARITWKAQNCMEVGRYCGKSLEDNKIKAENV